jgi:hypothetical protein
MSLRSNIAARHAAVRAANERGSLVLAMLIVMVGMALGALMIPIVLSQSGNTAHSDTRVQALHQAESGIDAMLGRIRGATSDGGVSGAPTLLPCGPVSFLTAPSPAPIIGYTVSVKYYTADPQVTPSTALLCSAGTHDPSTNELVVPTFARMTSIGTDTAGRRTSSRTLATTYAFSTTDIFTLNAANTNTTGGQIRLNPRALFAEDETECLAAPGVPEVGMPLAVQACSTDATPINLPMQQFFYDSNLSLRLAPSTSAAQPNGLCVSMSTTGNAITMEPCLTAGVGFVQQWSLNSDAAFVATPSSPTVCLAVRPTGVNIVAKACTHSTTVDTYDSTASWLPTPTVGDGAAGVPGALGAAGVAGVAGSQLVNFSQFGGCAQVANQAAPTSDPNPFILYPCEQRASPAVAPWFQQFSYDSSGRWVMMGNPADPSKTYCLTSQGVANQPVTVMQCAPTATPNLLQKWADYGAAAADQASSSQWSYDQRYRIVDHNGLCMSLNPTTDSSAAFVDPITAQYYSKITTETCNGGAPQKWNASPPEQSTTQSRVKDTTEK